MTVNNSVAIIMAAQFAPEQVALRMAIALQIAGPCRRKAQVQLKSNDLPTIR
jgi:hypothetical protein